MADLLKDKVGLITGGATGIGRATALAFAREGATVVIADILNDEGQAVADCIEQQGGRAMFIPCDVSRAEQVEAMIQKIVATCGRLDCAFNNAGIEGEAAPTGECSEANWDRVIAVNLKGVWLCMKYEIQQMRRQGGGAIVNAASVAGLVAERGLPAYAAAKGGVIQLTRTAAVEYAGCNIRINVVCPGVILTPMMERAMCQMRVNAMMPGAIRWRLLERITDGLLHLRPVQALCMSLMQPMGHPGQPEQVAEAVVWLCSECASFITGHSLVIDGGMTAQ